MQSRTKKSMSRARLISEAMRVVGPWYHGQRERSGGGGDGRGRSISHLAKSRNAAAADEIVSEAPEWATSHLEAAAENQAEMRCVDARCISERVFSQL